MKYDDLFRLDGKVALITGSSKGIGRATAEALAAQGAKVVISSRKLDKCEEVAKGIRDEGGDAVAIACNISHKEQLQDLVDRANAHYGRIDILVCNAAVNPYFGTLQDLPDEAYEKTTGANLRSNIWLCQMAIPQMADRKDGAVILISSGRRPERHPLSRHLRYYQGRRFGAGAQPVGRMGRPERAGERYRALDHQDGYGPRPVGERGNLQRRRKALCAQAHRLCRGDRRRGGLPRLESRQLHHRPHPRRRRRRDDQRGV